MEPKSVTLEKETISRDYPTKLLGMSMSFARLSTSTNQQPNSLPFPQEDLACRCCPGSEVSHAWPYRYSTYSAAQT